MYLVGEPIFDTSPRAQFFAPVSQEDLCRAVLLETRDPAHISQSLVVEYLAIIDGLKRMGVEFRIAYAHPENTDRLALSLCVQELGCRLVELPSELSPQCTLFPRDFCMMLPGIMLLRDDVDALIPQPCEYVIYQSPLGEGGRVLFAGATLLASEGAWIDEDTLHVFSPADFTPLHKAGIATGLFPMPAACALTGDGTMRIGLAQYNDHIDRVASLLEDPSGRLHLIVDPALISGSTRNDRFLRTSADFHLLSSEQTIVLLKERCKQLGITLHVPAHPLRIPCSLNLLQVSDGRVLMTSGDEALTEIVSSIVGNRRVQTTAAPIRYLPVWQHAGIRCIVGDFPEPLRITAKA